MNKQTKRTKRKNPPLVAKIDRLRIYGLSNDLSEGIESGTTGEWRAVALHFRNELDRACRRERAIRDTLTALDIAERMRALAMPEVRNWLDQFKGEEAS